MEWLDTIFARQPILQSERLELRPITLSDLGGMFDLYGDARLARTNAWDPVPDISAARAKIEKIQQQFRDKTHLRYGLFLRENPGEFIGEVAWVRFDARFKRVETGYNLRHAFHGRDLMTEADYTLLKYGFTQLPIQSFQAVVLPDNQPSVRLLERIGFAAEGRWRKAAPFQGGWEDLLIFGCLAEDLRMSDVAKGRQ